MNRGDYDGERLGWLAGRTWDQYYKLDCTVRYLTYRMIIAPYLSI